MLVANVRLPLVAPLRAGPKVTLAEHDAPTARVAGQLCVAPKAPLTLTPLTVIGRFPVLFKVTGEAADVVPTAWPEKLSEPMLVAAAACRPVPVKTTD